MCRTLIDGPVRSAIAKVRQIDTTSSTPAAARRVTSPPARETRAAVLLLVLSVGARLAWTYLAPNGANFVDLHVYVSGAASLDHPGTLYGYVYADQTRTSRCRSPIRRLRLWSSTRCIWCRSV